MRVAWERVRRALSWPFLLQSCRLHLGELMKSFCSFQLFTSWVPWQRETVCYGNLIVNRGRTAGR